MPVEERTFPRHSDRPLKGAGGSIKAIAGLLRFLRRRLLATAVIILIAGTIAGYVLWQFQRSVEGAGNNLLKVSRAIAQQTARELTEADQHLSRIVGAARDNPELLRDRGRRERMMRAELAGIPQAASIAYVDGDGARHIHARRNAYIRGPGFPVAAHPDGLAIREGSNKNPPALFLHRRLVSGIPEAGAVTMRLSDDYFKNLYRAWRGPASIMVTLSTPERRTVVQYPTSALGFNAVPYPGSPGVERLANGILRYTDPEDSRRYLFASQVVPGYALTLHTMTADEKWVGVWSGRHLLSASAVISLLIIGLLLALRRAGKPQRVAGALATPHFNPDRGTETALQQPMLGIAAEGVIVINDSGMIERVNQAAEQMFGYRADELVRRTVTMLMDTSDWLQRDGYIPHHLTAGDGSATGASRELTARRKDGTTFTVRLSLAERHIGGRRVFIGTLRDITQKKLSDALLRAETRIATTLSRAHKVNEVASDIVGALCSLGFEFGQWVVCAPVSREWRVSARYIATGVSEEKTVLLGEGASGPGGDGLVMRAWESRAVVWCTHLERNPENTRAAAALAAGLRAYVVLAVRSTSDAVAVIELYSASPDPRNPTLDSALSNIALQVGQLVSRLQAEQQLHTIIRTMPSAVFQARSSKRGTIALSFMSAQFKTLWGEPAATALTHTRSVLWKVPRAYRRQLVEGLVEAVLQGEGWDVTVPVKTGQDKANAMRWLRIHASPSRDEADARVWDGIISDVSEQKLAERQVVLLNLDLERRVEERTQELASLNTELEAFADAVSHDLRAPLRGMQGYAQMLEERALELPKDMRVLVERIITQGEHMEQLIAALLELSQISRHDLHKISTDISEIASLTLQELQDRDPARVLRWSVERGMYAYADPRLMRVMLENLLGNAWKFTRDQQEPVIEVASLAANPATFFVRDNGAGFDQQYAEKLFQPFQRLHPSSQFEGTGIGLATVQRIVRRHAGRIWADSTPQHGATFFFELPAQPGVNYTRGQ